MQWLALGIAIAISLALAARWFSRASPEQIVRGLRRAVIALALLVVLGLVLTGRLHWLFGLAAWLAPLLFGRLLRGSGNPAPSGSTRGQRSEVRTRYLDMTLDHDSGALDGTVIEGSFRGRRLSSMSLEDLRQLMSEASEDADTVNVLIAYLDRVHGEAWRRAAGGAEGQGSGPRGAASKNGMTREEALRILGLSPGASDAEIRDAHRRLMKQLHPDHGGSDYLAAKLNEAKEVLLGR